MNNGIEIAPQKDGPTVQAIHPGKVIFADHFQGYGNLLIIDHGLNYYTLYGHCAEFLVNKGDLVRGEQPIAIAGDTGSLKGISLYFEIRFKARPLDPLQWLRRR
jgi:septal ring factor EnvC (AmiA/AmiB activator)